MGSKRVRHKWETNISFHRNGHLTRYKTWDCSTFSLRTEVFGLFLMKSQLFCLIDIPLWKSVFFPCVLKISVVGVCLFCFFKYILCFCLGVALIYSAGEWLMLYYFKSNSCLPSWKYSLSPFSVSSSFRKVMNPVILSWCLFTFLSYFIPFCFSVLYFKLFT